VDNAAGPPEPSRRPLARELGLVGAVALGLGAMVGAGVFVLSGMAAGAAGPALILAFALNGLIALVVGCCYAELVAMMPRTGGAYVWAKPGLGPRAGFFAGWISWFAQLVACSLYATAFGSFASTLVQSVSGATPAAWHATAISIAILLTLLWVNYHGAGDAGRLEIVVTGLKVAIILVVVSFGLLTIAGNPEPLAPFTPFFPEGASGLLGAMGLTFIAFEGYEVIVQAAEEVKRPSKTIPRAILVSICIAVALYLLVAIVMLGAVEAPPGQSLHHYFGRLGELGLIETAGQFVPGGRLMLLVAGLASTASALNATVYGSTRIAFAMGRGGDLPDGLGRVHPKRRTPHVAIAVSGALMLLVLLALPIRDIAAAADIMFLLVFSLVCATVIRLRKLWPNRERPFRVPLSPLLPGIGIAAGLTLSVGLFQLSVAAWVTAAAWLAIGLAVVTMRRKSGTTSPRHEER
jgi:APA family basic amino acid/polyamine antiporter